MVTAKFVQLYSCNNITTLKIAWIPAKTCPWEYGEYIINTEVDFVGYLSILVLTNVQKMEHIIEVYLNIFTLSVCAKWRSSFKLHNTSISHIYASQHQHQPLTTHASLKMWHNIKKNCLMYWTVS